KSGQIWELAAGKILAPLSPIPQSHSRRPTTVRATIVCWASENRGPLDEASEFVERARHPTRRSVSIAKAHVTGRTPNGGASCNRHRPTADRPARVAEASSERRRPG